MHKNITLYGQVQGVFFRQSAKKEADKRGLTGYVQNNPDGTVSLQVEGHTQMVHEFIDWCKLGSKGARVEKVEIEDGSPDQSKDFSIRV